MTQLSTEAVYAFAKVESWLEAYAKEKHMELPTLVGQVARMLANGYATVEPTPTPRGTVGRPRKFKTDSMGRKHISDWRGKHPYWSKLTAKERSAEMHKRMLARIAKRAKMPMGGVA